MFGKRVPNCVKREHVDYCVNCGDLVFPEEMDLHEDQKMVQAKMGTFCPDGKIRGPVEVKSKGEGKSNVPAPSIRNGQEEKKKLPAPNAEKILTQIDVEKQKT